MTDQEKRVEELESRLAISNKLSIWDVARDAIALARSLEEDARRYRWLRDSPYAYMMQDGGAPSGAELDSEIDAAIQEKSK